MHKRFSSKVALITGGTRGIGFAIAERLGQEGASVVICSRKLQNVEHASKLLRDNGVNVFSMQCHVGDSRQRSELVTETIRRFGSIDILVSNVATNPVMEPMISTTEKVWDKVMDTNVKSHFFLAQAVVPHMPDGGTVIFISSYAAYKPNPYLGVYSVSKTALVGLTKALALSVADRSIRVNCLAPGIIKTRFSEGLWKGDEVSKQALKDIPLDRFGTPEECASVVAFLASDDASYVTGEVVVVNGGIHSRM